MDKTRTPTDPTTPPRKTGGVTQAADLAPPDAPEEERSFSGMTGEAMPGGDGDLAVESPRPERDAGKPGGMIGED